MKEKNERKGGKKKKRKSEKKKREGDGFIRVEECGY